MEFNAKQKQHNLLYIKALEIARHIKNSVLDTLEQKGVKKWLAHRQLEL